MAKSNEIGRAFEYLIRTRIAGYLQSKGIHALATDRTAEKDRIERGYYTSLGAEKKADFNSAAASFLRWLESKNFFESASRVVLDRVPDNEAKKYNDKTDLRIEITKPKSTEQLNFSIKNKHDALCHPRLPSLASQCKIADSRIDEEYRESYIRIWESFHSKIKNLGEGIKTYKDLDRIDPNFKEKHFFRPMQQNVVDFLNKHANDPGHCASFFRYLVGRREYYVLKNSRRGIEVKHFCRIKNPRSFAITYPYQSKQKTFLIEFDNGWKIALRIHTASSRIEKPDGSVFMTEKEDPICLNLKDMIKIEKIKK
jgi:hypothetical protein